MEETQHIEKKSLRIVLNNSADWNALAKECVCFANARGGMIFIGVEDKNTEPPLGQKVEDSLPAKIRKRIAELTVNVATQVEKVIANNGSEYVELRVLQSVSTIASTTDGRYYYRVSDECKPLPPEDLMRLLIDKPAFIWETKPLRNVRRTEIDLEKMRQFVEDIRASERVTTFIKEKSPDELLDYYLMSDGESLTNLGVLWVGKRTDRAKLLYGNVIQFFKYDESGSRVNKIVWDDFSLNPKEMIEAVWTQIPDWKEGVEVSDGIFRKFIPSYEEEVIRELIANALVHRPYTTRGDIFINLYTDRIEIHNPGLLPPGVTPENMLHKTFRRNEHLAKVFYDLKLMEREGTGYDKMYEVLLSNGKQLPVVTEEDDRVTVTIMKRITRDEVIKLLSRANEEYQLRQKEIICLGLIAQHTTLSAIEFSKNLSLKQQNAIRDWLGRLIDLGLVKTKGKTKGVEYYLNPDFLRNVDFKGKTNLKKIEDHRLKELIFQDLKVYPNSSVSDIHQRVGNEIPIRKIKSQLYDMVQDNTLVRTGERKTTRYFINKTT